MLIWKKLLLSLSLVLLPCNLPNALAEDNTNDKNSDLTSNNSNQIEEILSHTDYNIIFDNKIVEDAPIELLEIGNLSVPSGKIVVCDPLVYPDTPPLTKSVKPGSYPIKIYIAKTPDWGDRYAIAKLEFSRKRAKKWVMALRPGQDIKEIKSKTEFFGFPVDAGLGSFSDLQASKKYQMYESDFVEANPKKDIYNDVLEAEFGKNAKDKNDPNDPGNWTNFKIPGSDLNIAMFQSGFGDGYYPSYWGIDENEEIVSLVIDFQVLLFPEDE